MAALSLVLAMLILTVCGLNGEGREEADESEEREQEDEEGGDSDEEEGDEEGEDDEEEEEDEEKEGDGEKEEGEKEKDEKGEKEKEKEKEKKKKKKGIHQVISFLGKFLKSRNLLKNGINRVIPFLGKFFESLQLNKIGTDQAIPVLASYFHSIEGTDFDRTLLDAYSEFIRKIGECFHGNTDLCTENNIDVAARVVFGEARGESTEGQLAVAFTIVNRINSNNGLYPETFNDVVYATYGAGLHEYNTLDDPRHDREWNAAKSESNTQYNNAITAATGALCGYACDPTNGATAYCAYDPCSATTTDRASVATNKIKIGNHWFVRRIPHSSNGR